MKNYRLNEKDYRSRIQAVIYEAMGMGSSEYFEMNTEVKDDE